VIRQHPRAGKVKLVAPAVSYNGQRMPVRRPPPWLSEHTTEVSQVGDGWTKADPVAGQVLEDLGYSGERIAELRGKGIV
jgi:succinate--hydroxymethylglutarate CoA-transferase